MTTSEEEYFVTFHVIKCTPTMTPFSFCWEGLG
jgi:hypothetical protein